MYITPVEVKVELDLVEAYHIIGALTVALAHTDDEGNYNAMLAIRDELAEALDLTFNGDEEFGEE